MCDYSLHAVKSRPAQVGDKLVSASWAVTVTRGLAAQDGDAEVAVCLLPGTEVAFEKPPEHYRAGFWPFERKTTESCVARFRQLNKDRTCEHHDAFEFSDGFIMKINDLEPGQRLTVLQLPSQKKRTVVIAEKVE